MENSQETALLTAEHLLTIKAIKLNDKEPFTWASGRKSPIYCDNRKTLSYPTIRTYIRQEFVRMIENRVGPVDVIAGVATGGIAQGALVAQELGLPFVYVRSEAKKHGLTNMIEGDIKEGQSVVVVEDLISTGKSSLLVVDALREAGCDVKAMVAIFTYNLEVASENFEKARVPLYTLTDYPHLLECAKTNGILSEHEILSLQAWRENPERWSEERMK